MGLLGNIFPLFLFLLPFALLAFIFYWVHILKVNSDKKIEQNEQIIKLLKEICKK
jgi:cytochrome c oxidase assembly factor CtaG